MKARPKIKKFRNIDAEITLGTFCKFLKLRQAIVSKFGGCQTSKMTFLDKHLKRHYRNSNF